MNEDTEFGYKVRQILNQGVEKLDRDVEGRLHDARQTALRSQRVSVVGLRMAGIRHAVEIAFLTNTRSLIVAMALMCWRHGHLLLECF